MDTDTIVYLVILAVWGLIVYLNCRADLRNQRAMQKAWREKHLNWDWD